jgi:iron complex outermembrane receptor protein
MKRLFFSAFAFVTLGFANDLDMLLQDYQKESDFSKKTKDESAGNLIIYTRDDLERMQVETLKDILKSLRAFIYAENRIAQPDLLNQDPITYYSKGVRIYLNEHELLTPLTGSGFITFGDMDMDFIDHVEIYEGFPTFEFGIEPATIVIRLYTKSAEHDAGGRVKFSVGSYGSNKENVYYTGSEENFDYALYANHSENNRNTKEIGSQSLKRDKKTNEFYASLNTQHHLLELQAVNSKGDAFLGSLIGSVPKDTQKEFQYLRLSTSSKFMQDSLVLNLSYMKQKDEFSSEYDLSNPIYLPSDTPPFVMPVYTYAQTIDEESFTANLQKEFIYKNNDISVGIQYRYKYFDLTDVKFNDIDNNVSQAYKKENVYSAFIQDLITLSQSHMLTFSLMHQIYERKGDVDKPHTTQVRFGYIYSDKSWVAKTFISSQEFASEPYMTISPYYGNPELQPESYKSIFEEISYTTKQTLSKLVLGYGRNYDVPILVEQGNALVMQNADRDIDGYSASLEFTYFFRKKDKLELQANYTLIESPYGNESGKYKNYVMRMLNSVGKFDIFNEFIINSGYERVDTGYDYSAGIRYEATKDLHFNLKGENIFNTALKQSFFTNLLSKETVEVPITEQKFTVSMEYLF